MRTIVRLVLAVVVVLVAAWLGLWWYAEGRMQAGMINWADQMAANGNGDVKVSYDSLARGSSPLAATVTVTNLQLTVQAQPTDTPFSILLPSFTMRIDAASPLVQHFDLPPQVNISGARGQGAITFGSVDVAEYIDPMSLFKKNVSPFRGADATASNINLLASSGSLLVLHADHYALHGTVDEAAGAGQPAFASTTSLDGLAISPLLTRIASIPFGGKIGHLALTANVFGPLPANWQDVLHRLDAEPMQPADRKLLVQAAHDWAAHGGRASGSVSLAVGPSTLNADGALKFDAATQPAGTANVTADHLDAFSGAITSAYPQLQDEVNTIQARLSPYLSSTDTGGQTLALHVAYGGGTVNVNGKQASTLPPLDWATLENPPAPLPVPPQAPGDGSGAAVTPGQ
jgi:Uncharacterized protein conserved in bacteria (DUF2125)